MAVLGTVAFAAWLRTPGRGVTFHGVTFHGFTFHVYAVTKGCPTWRQPPVPGKNPASTKDDGLASSTAPVASTA